MRRWESERREGVAFTRAVVLALTTSAVIWFGVWLAAIAGIGGAW